MTVSAALTLVTSEPGWCKNLSSCGHSRNLTLRVFPPPGGFASQSISLQLEKIILDARTVNQLLCSAGWQVYLREMGVPALFASLPSIKTLPPLCTATFAASYTIRIFPSPVSSENLSGSTVLLKDCTPVGLLKRFHQLLSFLECTGYKVHC